MVWNRLTTTPLLAVLAVAALSPALLHAHHGTAASYDSTMPTTLSGVVTEFVFSNPHAQIYFDVTDASGTVVSWGGELNSPANLRRDGWSKDTFKPGDRLTLTVHPSRAGAPRGNVDRSKPVIVNGTPLPGRAARADN
jgi:hypothetical protein